MSKTTRQRRLGSWVAADIARFEDGLVRKHWDVLQGEATEALHLHAAITPYRLEKS
jgi:hypothetical protein